MLERMRMVTTDVMEVSIVMEVSMVMVAMWLWLF